MRELRLTACTSAKHERTIVSTQRWLTKPIMAVHSVNNKLQGTIFTALNTLNFDFFFFFPAPPPFLSRPHLFAVCSPGPALCNLLH